MSYACEYDMGSFNTGHAGDLREICDYLEEEGMIVWEKDARWKYWFDVADEWKYAVRWLYG